MADDQQVPDIADGANGWAILDPADPRLQAVNESQQFTPHLLDYMKNKWSLVDQGFDYNVVAVFGSQSTGKSTLLNRLFGTNFDVMSETSRQQTTKGIWVSKADNAPLLVLDVEGTDGRERGEDQDFERKSALFSLAISEVLIINMWENQVGLYNGANMGLLKTVFDVNLQLFQSQGSPKTCLFFVIRDFTGMTPLESLAESVKGDLERIWAGLNKPEGKENAVIGDFFEFRYAGMPHKVFQPEKFEEAAKNLRASFYEKGSPDFTFKPIFHKAIPADGFPKFAESIWEKIVSNRDLDLPTQQQLLAQYRCDEIMRVAYEVFMEKVQGYQSQLEFGKVLEQLGGESQEAYSQALEAFDKDASRYNKDVYQKKRGEFIDKMSKVLQVYFVQQLRNLHKRALALFQQTLTDKLKGDESDFAAKLRDARGVAENYYRRVAEATKLEDANWSFDEYYAQFVAEIEEIASKKRQEAMDKVVKGSEKSITDGLTEPIEVLLNESNPDLWRGVVNTFKETVSKTEATLQSQLAGFESSADEITSAVGDMKLRAWQVLQEILRNEFADVKVIERLRTRFESKFRYDEHGLPKLWKPGDDIDGAFTRARNEADKLWQLYSKMDVPIEELDQTIVSDERFDRQSLVVLSPAKLQALRDKFKKEADLLFVEAKRSMVVTTAKIPPWFIVMTVMLGWNEFTTVLYNPIYFVTLLLIAAGIYAVWYTGTARPVLNIARAMLKESGNQVGLKLREKGVNVDGIMDGTLLRNSTTMAVDGVKRMQKEMGRSATTPDRRRHNGHDDDVELVPTASSAQRVAERRRTTVGHVEN
ncbi:Dynamin-like GTPase that mediates homotypic ER fusion [Gaertneriomyces sp. JEL0708]|nr:Dynamin-like GTPase that mediates homotypic ER fusion [Gaertneriomyces sp. JEL0708]